MSGKSDKAFKKNVKTEYEAGKPLKQSLAIAYSMKKKSKKMAEGGMAAMHGEQSDAHECEMCGGKGCMHCNEEMEHDRHDDAGEPMMAEGGQIIDNYNSPSTAMHQTQDGSVDPEEAYDPMHEGDHKRPNSRAMSEDDRALGQHGAHEEGPQGTWMAEGGQITDNYADTEDGDGRDMVGRIMAQRQQMYSKGGQVANNTDLGWGKGERRDDMGSGQYDDLVIRDNDMESADYTGTNSGDNMDDARENKDRKDIVARAMKAKRMKSSMDGMSGYGRSDKSIKQNR
jgi:hypothetical protein